MNGNICTSRRQPRAAGTASLQPPSVGAAVLSPPPAAAAAGRAVGEARAQWVGTRQKEGLAAQPAQPTEFQAGVKQTHIRSHLLEKRWEC